jgi:hypothetical protein
MVERVSRTARFTATRTLRQLLLASLTIAAILLGLVGMHALSAGAHAHGSDAAHSQMSPGLHSEIRMTTGPADGNRPAIASALLISAGKVTAQVCTGMCQTDCLLLGMVCTLSLLFVLIGLVLGKLASPPLSGVRRVMRIPRIDISVFVLPSTPSLHALSISRT